MKSGLYPFATLLEKVRIKTGITNIRNQIPTIRNLVTDAVFEINPYAGYLIKKRMIFHKGFGNFDGKNIKKPTDLVIFDKFGCSQDPLCSACVRETANHFVLCDQKDRDKISFTYWGLQGDGEGNPIISRNHSEAVAAYVVWNLYSPKIFMGEGNRNVSNDFKEEWEDRCHEARGEDFFPDVHQINEMSRMSAISTRELESTRCNDYCVSCECLETIEDNNFMKNKVYWWQLKNINDVISNKSQVTDQFLSEQNQITLGEAINGGNYAYPYIGRIGFCIEDVQPDSIEIFDILNQNMNNTLKSIYDVEKRRLILVSNDYISNSTIYFKFSYNE